MALERLQKIISQSGVTSRRKAEELITAGRVSVNGEFVRELGSKADSAVDDIKVDGKRLRFPNQILYLALNKPRGYVSTLSDPEGRPTVISLLKKIKERVYPVGRLDFNSEGLLLLTNDGEFANRMTSASSGILKTYWVKVKGAPEEKALDQLRHGVVLDKRPTLPARIRALRAMPQGMREVSNNTWYEVGITEGRKNQIRRMFELAGHPVQKLKRVRVGPIGLGALPVGQFRFLTTTELRQLQNLKRARRPK